MNKETNWKKWYFALIATLTVLVVLFYSFSKHFS